MTIGNLAGQRLTDREVMFLDMMSRGLTNLQIANRLDLTGNTVATTLRRICIKLGAASRTHAVRIAYETEVLKTPEGAKAAHYREANERLRDETEELRKQVITLLKLIIELQRDGSR